MTFPYRLSALAAFAASISVLAAPVAALDLPSGVRGGEASATGVANQAGWGWGGGRDRHHRGGGVGAGDVIAGVLVLGAIAAIAGSGRSRNNDRRQQVRNPEPDYRNRDDYRPREDDRSRVNGNYQSSRGIDSAVGMCVEQVERGDDRVDSVDNAARTSDGWRVSGALQSGSPWNCWIDNDGRIREVDFARDASASNAPAPAVGQLSDDAYARARAEQGSARVADAPAAGVPTDAGPQPAYPGGPLPGEEGYEEAVRARAAI